MNIEAKEHRTYRVELVPDRMRRSEMGSGPLGTRVRCSVPLSGELDEHWRQSFRTVQLEDSGLFRFRLEMASNTVAFLITESQGKGAAASELRALASLLDSVNLVASKS